MLSIINFMGRKYDVVREIRTYLQRTKDDDEDEEKEEGNETFTSTSRLHICIVCSWQRLWEKLREYRNIDKTVMRSLLRLFNTCSNMKRIKHRQFNRNNYYSLIKYTLIYALIELCLRDFYQRRRWRSQMYIPRCQIIRIRIVIITWNLRVRFSTDSMQEANHYMLWCEQYSRRIAHHCDIILCVYEQTMV